MENKGRFLDYASLFPLVFLTTDLLFITNQGQGLIYARTEGLLWASSHYLSLVAVVGTAWALIALDRFKVIFWNVLAMFNLGSIHEILFSRLYYVHSLSVFFGTWLSFGISLLAILIGFRWGKPWLRIAMVSIAIFLPIYFFLIGQYQPPTVLISGGFNEPWASMPGPNLLDISSWAIPCGIFLIVRHFYGIKDNRPKLH